MKLLDLSIDETRRLREFFREAKYTQESFHEILQSEIPGSTRMRNLPRLDYLTREPDQIRTLIRCFLVGLSIEADRIDSAIPQETLALFEKGGLIEREEAMYNAAVVVQPIDNALIASDVLVGDLPEDVVFAVNASSVSLAQSVPREHFESVLDLGTGTGVLALGVSPRAGKIVATDLSPRALTFAEFNTRLNGVDNVEFVEGERFEPLKGRTFDLALCNPPYLLTPAMQCRYSDNEMPLDEFCGTLVREAPAYLAEGGLFQMVLQWVEIEGQPWQDRLTAWAEGSGCDYWVIQNYSVEPNQYVERMLLNGLGDRSKTSLENYVDWMDGFRSAGVRRIHGGYIFLRKRSGQNWVRVEEIEHPLRKPFGSDVLRGFRNRDFLNAHPHDELLTAKLQLAENVQLVQTYTAGDGRWRPENIKDLAMIGGLGYRSGVDGHVATLLAQFDGERILGQILESEASAEKRAELLNVIRGLIQSGFLCPSESTSQENSRSMPE